MGTRAFAVLVAVVFGGVIGACKSDLLPGRCDKDSDCDSKKCDLTTEGNGRCVPNDGGSGDADASGPDAADAGDAHDAFSCEAAMCGGEMPVCDVSMMKCRACATNPECLTVSAATPVCASNGTCVACVGSTDCSDAAPICTVATNTCAKCAGHDECKARAATTPACAGSGKCVECTMNNHCGPTSTKPVCDTTMNTCTGCKVGGTECATINSAKPACAATGACVECVSNADCKDTKPICDTTSNTCKPCKADAECTFGPKVCMSHQDGRCATEAETIYVEAKANCATTVGATGGTATVPYCAMDSAVMTLGTTTTKDLVVVTGNVSSGTMFAVVGRPVSIVGKVEASVTGSPAIKLSAGDLFIRRVTISAGMFSLGCQADSGSMLRLDHVLVTGNRGGIYLNGAAFDIQNTTISDNYGLSTMGTSWAGVFVSNPPAAGPKKLQLVTVDNNKAPGIVCTSTAQGTGVRASGNALTEITTIECGFSPCGAASATCGAQP